MKKLIIIIIGILFACANAFGATELLDKRTYTSKIIDNEDGSFTLEASSGHIHYKDDAGDYKDIDIALEDMGNSWRMRKASYNLEIAKYFGLDLLIIYTNKYEGANHTITNTPHSVWWVDATDKTKRTKIADAQFTIGVASGNVIRYTNAFGPGIHFEITLKRRGFKKEIVIDEQSDLGVSPYADYFVVPIFKWQSTGLKIKAEGLADWDELTYYEHDGAFEIREIATGKKSHIKQAYAIDSSTPRKKRKKLKMFFEKKAGALWQGKLISKAMIDNAVFPIRADTDFGPAAGDGNVGHDGSDWDTVHNATSGFYPQDFDITVQVVREGGGTGFEMNRAFIPIDTSGLPDSPIISSAVLTLRITASTADITDSNSYIAAVQTSQAGTTTLVGADYDNCGATHSPTEGSDQIAHGVWNATNPKSVAWTLDITGRGWIVDDGDTLLGLRLGSDLNDVEPADGANKFTADDSGGTTPPVLAITFTVAFIPTIKIF